VNVEMAALSEGARCSRVAIVGVGMTEETEMAETPLSSNAKKSAFVRRSLIILYLEDSQSDER
jgi:hypothetical protein